MSNPPPFKGIDVLLSGTVYVLPRLSFGGFERAKDLLRRIVEQEINDPVELQNAFVDVLLIGFQRNYPDLARELLADSLDWDNAPDLFSQLLAMSIPQAKPGELKAESPSGASLG